VGAIINFLEQLHHVYIANRVLALKSNLKEGVKEKENKNQDEKNMGLTFNQMTCTPSRFFLKSYKTASLVGT
jgi:hypothetical protein